MDFCIQQLKDIIDTQEAIGAWLKEKNASKRKQKQQLIENLKWCENTLGNIDERNTDDLNVIETVLCEVHRLDSSVDILLENYKSSHDHQLVERKHVSKTGQQENVISKKNNCKVLNRHEVTLMQRLSSTKYVENEENDIGDRIHHKIFKEKLTRNLKRKRTKSDVDNRRVVNATSNDLNGRDVDSFPSLSQRNTSSATHNSPSNVDYCTEEYTSEVIPSNCSKDSNYVCNKKKELGNIFDKKTNGKGKNISVSENETNNSKSSISHNRIDNGLEQQAEKSVTTTTESLIQEQHILIQRNVEQAADYERQTESLSIDVFLESKQIHDEQTDNTFREITSQQELWSVLSVRDEDNSCISSEDSITLEKHQYKEKEKIKNTRGLCKEEDNNTNIGEPSVNRKEENTAEWILKGEVESSGYHTYISKIKSEEEDHKIFQSDSLSARVTPDCRCIHRCIECNRTVTGSDNGNLNNDDASTETGATVIDIEEKQLEEECIRLRRENKVLEREGKKLKRKMYLKKELANLQQKNKEHLQSIKCLEKQSDNTSIDMLYERNDDDMKRGFVQDRLHLIPSEYKRPVFDALILYDSDDYKEAEEFRKHLINDFICKNGVRIKAALYDGPDVDTDTNLVFEHLDVCFDCCNLKFIFLTQNFLTNRSSTMCKDSFVSEALFQKTFHRCIIPVYAHPGIKAPMGLNSLVGINYFKKDDPSYKTRVLKLFEKSVVKRKEKDEAQIRLQYEFLMSILDQTSNKNT